MLVAAEARQLSVRASEDDVRLASGWLEQTCGELNVPAEQILRLDLCLNEVLANIIAHGGSCAREAPVILSLDAGSDGGDSYATLSLSDAGKPFNPLMVSARPQARTLADATPGGLGLTMIANYSDRLDYAFRDGRNHLDLTIRWNVSSW
jgi:anti-sigma regulatory factor (Ser/Thr protein kinase)